MLDLMVCGQALKKYPEEYKKWEEVGFDVNYLFEIKDDTLIAYDRFTLLHLAAKNGHADVVNALIQNGANVNTKDNFKSLLYIMLLNMFV